jgi:hypothetical protein
MRAVIYHKTTGNNIFKTKISLLILLYRKNYIQKMMANTKFYNKKTTKNKKEKKNLNKKKTQPSQ